MTKIYARQCKIKKLDYTISKEFLNKNHRQGNAYSKICYGLFYNGELVHLMSFGNPRFNKNYQWEIIRECTKKNYIVQGATSKVWKHFLKNENCRSCICYHYPTNGVETTHLVDHCGFKTIEKAQQKKKIYFEGKWRGKTKRIDKSILERHGVDRLLNTEQGHDRTNEQILLDLGFTKKEEDGLSPQIDIYYPFSVLYRADDLTNGNFYIGMCESKTSWEDDYKGSGKIWQRYIKKYPNHTYKRTILEQNFKTPRDLRKAELKELKKYCIQAEDGRWIIDKTTKCKNAQYRTQGDPFISSTICLECGKKGGKHSKDCSCYKGSTCPECGVSYGQHLKTCSKYKKPEPCKECGGKNGKHRKECSKYIPKKPSSIVCPDCGAKGGNHKKDCPHYIQRGKPCPECGNLTSHKPTCSHYVKITFNHATCEECGAKDGKHKETCSHFNKKNKCPECGGLYGSHFKTCSKDKKCPECGYSLQSKRHAKGCSHAKEQNICSECGGLYGSHYATCSKDKKCPECGYSLSSHQHAKTCSHYTKLKSCKECGGKDGKHFSTCSKYKAAKPCSECGGKNGHHKSTCSKAKKCPECGYATSSHTHAKTCSHYKEPKKMVCPECGGTNNRHKNGCSKYNPIVCSECGGKMGKHKKGCSKYGTKS